MPPVSASASASAAASAELNALRDAVTCVVGFAELLAAEAAPGAAWAGALEANGRELLSGFARVERALRAVEAQAAAASAGGSYR